MKHSVKFFRGLALALALTLCLGLLTACGGEKPEDAAASTQNTTLAAENAAPNGQDKGNGGENAPTQPTEAAPAPETQSGSKQETDPRPAGNGQTDVQPSTAYVFEDSMEDLGPYPDSDTMEDLSYDPGPDSGEDLP